MEYSTFFESRTFESWNEELEKNVALNIKRYGEKDTEKAFIITVSKAECGFFNNYNDFVRYFTATARNINGDSCFKKNKNRGCFGWQE